MTDETPRAFTGRRRRATRRRVVVAERLSRLLITVGGIGTILAVAGIFVFLVWVVLPLFQRAEVHDTFRVPAAQAPAGGRVVYLAMDEYQVLGLAVFQTGELRVFRLDTGAVLEERELFPDATLTAWSFPVGDDRTVFGFLDGTVRVGRIGFAPTFLDADAVPEAARTLGVGQVTVHGAGVLERTPEGQYRLQAARFDVDDPVRLEGGGAVRLLDHVETGTGLVFAAFSEGGRLSLYTTSSKTDLRTRKVTTTVREVSLPLETTEQDPPRHVRLGGVGDTVYVAWEDGRVVRLDARDRSRPVVAETLDLLPEEGVRLTAFQPLIGRSTFVAGDSRGRTRAWFLVRPEEPANTSDGQAFTAAHELPARSAPVTALAPSPRSRQLAIGYGDGIVRTAYVTSEAVLLDLEASDASVLRLAIAPKDDGVVALTGTGLARWRYDPKHPEATVGTLFGKVWYEGHPEPQHVWQSSSGTDDFEPKLGLVPLVFGTLKGTLYSMLFGVPLALLAAIFTSEFLHPRLRTSIKGTVEIMAGLPSVVLGFLAALVIAPFVQGFVPAVLVAFVAIPFLYLLGACLWQTMPQGWGLRLSGWPRILVMVAALPVGVLVARALGPTVEEHFFAGDLDRWLDGQIGDGTGAWMFLLLPLAALASAVAMGRWVRPGLQRVSRDWSRGLCASVDLGRFLFGVALTGLLAWGVAWLLAHPAGAGIDPRGEVVGTYVQRNALVVGFVMGFAIIPIVYTLAEDALSSVPMHLREASLGAGATRWQTASRIVVPTAMSGLFSAVMIGLGRAVGETMIVLMAAGNTPIMEWNPFSGFRTLSANIAVELPEAVRNSTHYRTLFLAALTLFAMTFVLNTAAEAVRQRFRRRAYQL